MKKLLLKTAFLIAATTLILINIQLLFDTNANPFFSQSALKASPVIQDNTEDPTIEYMMIRGDRFKKKRFIRHKNCYIWDLSLTAGISMIGKYFMPEISDIEFNIRTKGQKWVCRRNFDPYSFCDRERLTECEPIHEGDENGGGETQELH